MAADCQGRLSPISSEIREEEALDPRIHVELERLNKASDDINKLELELDDERASFRQALSDTTHKLNALAKKLGSCVEKARPYYDQRHKVLESHTEAQKVALRFERACSMHEAAKEMVQLAEQGYMRGEASKDPAWQEMLNHATMKVNEAEKERNESEKEHRKTMTDFQDADEKCQKLQKELKRAITKSRPYFELKAAVNQQMEDNKRAIKILEEDVHSAKVMYSEALRNLEKISDSIHQQRIEKQHEMELGERGAGVGSETPSPPPVRQKDNSSIEGRNADSSNTEEYAAGQSESFHSIQSSLPSVIHESVERSRNQSYRNAIERKASNTENDEFPVPSLESEYMSLPQNTSHKSMVGKKGSEIDTNLSSVRQRQTENVKTSVNQDSINVRQRSNLPREETPSSVTTTGSHRSSKLKGGLILRVDSAMDPLTQKFQTQSIQPTRRKNKTHVESQRRSEMSSGYVSDNRSLSQNVTPTQNKIFSPPTSSPSHSSLSSALSVPDDDRSDVESIASTGPMLDDYQVEFLTMDFSEDVFNEEEEQAKKLDRQDSRRLSLPQNLSHLERYIRQISKEKENAAISDELSPEMSEKVCSDEINSPDSNKIDTDTQRTTTNENVVTVDNSHSENK